MKKSGVGEKRPRDTGDQNKGVKFIRGLKLSQHPPEQKKDLFLNKLNNIVRSKSLHPTQFEGYTIRECFSKMGWEQLLNLNCEKMYRRVVIEWMSSLTKNGDELRGIVDGRCYSITPAVIRGVLGVDTRKDLPYGRFSEIPIVENGSRWLEACNTVFGLHENGKLFYGYARSKMTPLAKILWTVMFSAFHDSVGDEYEVWPREIYLLHALYTGDVLYSFALLMIDDIWDMYEDENQHNIPHGSYISMILNSLGAVSKGECDKPQIISLEDGVILSKSCRDQRTKQRVTFPMKVTNIQKQMKKRKQQQYPIPQENKRKEPEKEKWTDERERQAEILYEEREKWAEEREKWAEEREKRAEERERRAEEKEKRAKEREKQYEERVRQAEICAREREKRVEGRTEERERRAQESEKKRDIRIQEREKSLEERVKRAHEREKRAIERERQSKIRVREREKFVEEREQWAEDREREAEIRALEREKRAQEMEIWAKERDRKAEIRIQEREKRVEDAEVRAQEKERRAEDIEREAEIRAQVMEKRAQEAEVRARERERHAEDMERQAEIRAQQREKRAEEAEARAQVRERYADDMERQVQIEREKQAVQELLFFSKS